MKQKKIEYQQEREKNQNDFVSMMQKANKINENPFQKSKLRNREFGDINTL